MKTNKGFTLIEIAVVLAVLAILAAILTPIVTSYIDQSRVVKANNDVKKISEAVTLYKRDTGVWPAYSTFAGAQTNTTPTVTCLESGTSKGLIPSGWTCAPATTDLLSTYLNFATAAGLPNSTEIAANGGRVTFRGPYLDGLTGLDPWEHPYVVNSGELKVSATNWAMAASAGPNGTLETSQTTPNTSSLVALGDDIVSPINNIR